MLTCSPISLSMEVIFGKLLCWKFLGTMFWFLISDELLSKLYSFLIFNSLQVLGTINFQSNVSVDVSSIFVTVAWTHYIHNKHIKYVQTSDLKMLQRHLYFMYWFMSKSRVLILNKNGHWYYLGYQFSSLCLI